MNHPRLSSVLSLRSLSFGLLLCLWLVGQGLATTHSHEGVQIHADCAMCHMAQVQALPGSTFPITAAVPTRDHDALAPALSPAVASPARCFLARAPPTLS